MCDRMRTVLAAFVIAFVTLSAQSPQQPPPVFRVGADLVEVDVVVRGKDGAFVSDLAADDFVIEEGGHAQPIQQFYLRLTTTSGWTDKRPSTSPVDSGAP